MATQTQERRLAFLATALPPIVWVVVFFLAPLAIVWAYSFGQNVGLTQVDISGTFATAALVLSGALLAAIAAVLWIYIPGQIKTMEKSQINAQTIPSIALAPIFLHWFGYGLTSKVVMAAMISFFALIMTFSLRNLFKSIRF